jgi:CheY-like chemotaxis protein
MVVEDSPEDFAATTRGFRKAGLRNPIIHCRDRDEALEYLHRRGDYADPESAPRPGVILLDLNLPGTDGREVLADIKSNDELRSIPVVVLTTSNDERDIEACSRAGANSYVQKPVDLHGFIEAIRRLKDYWLEVSILLESD